MNQLEVLKSFSCEEPIEVLRKLYQKSKSKTGELRDLPFVSIFLSGTVVSGVLVSLEETSKDTRVIIAETDSSCREAMGVIYLNASEMKALTVKSFNQYAQVLRPVIKNRHAGEKVPSKLSINRLVKEFENQFFEKSNFKIEFVIDWEKISDSESILFNLQDFTSELIGSISKIGEDLSGKEALKAVRQVRVASWPGRSFEISMKDQNLQVDLDLEDIDFENLKNVIVSKIEKLI